MGLTASVAAFSGAGRLQVEAVECGRAWVVERQRQRREGGVALNKPSDFTAVQKVVVPQASFRFFLLEGSGGWGGGHLLSCVWREI